MKIASQDEYTDVYLKSKNLSRDDDAECKIISHRDLKAV